MISELESLTTTCAHCGKQLLTLVGAVVQDDNTDPRHRALQGLEMACDCEAAMWADKQLNAEIAALQVQKEANEQEERLKSRLRLSGMPDAWHERGLGAWLRRTENERAAYDAVVNFGRQVMRGERQSLYIAGPIGTGKTMLASCLSLDLIRKGCSVSWSNVGDLLRSLRATYNSNTNEADVIRRYTSPGILVLDDLGKERPTEWAVEQLFAIFNKRYDERKITVVTTNYGGADLVKRLTPRPDATGYADDTTARAIVDRLRGTSTLVVLEGESKR